MSAVVGGVIMRRIAFSGCRDFTPSEKQVEWAFQVFVRADTEAVLVGDCPTGVDEAIREYCSTWKPKVYTADWDNLGRKAGPIRNKAMIDDADCLIAFWDGKSRGTGNCIKCANDKNIPVLILPAKTP